MNIGDRVFTTSGFVWIVAAVWPHGINRQGVDLGTTVGLIRFNERRELIAYKTHEMALANNQHTPTKLFRRDRVTVGGLAARVVRIDQDEVIVRLRDKSEQRVVRWILELEKLAGNRWREDGALRQAELEEI